MSQPTESRPTNSGTPRRSYDALAGDFSTPPSTRTAAKIHRPVVAAVMVGLGVVMGIASVSLLTNTYGNTASLGLLLTALAGSAIAMGACSLRRRWTVVLGIGVVALLVGPMLVAFFHWTLYLFGVY